MSAIVINTPSGNDARIAAGRSAEGELRTIAVI